MKLYNVVQIKAEDFPQEDQPTVERLGNIINPFMQQVVELADGRIDFENVTYKFKEFEITVDSSGKPILNDKIQVGKSSILGFQIIDARNLTNSLITATQQPFIAGYFLLGGGVVQITKITGLVENNKFRIRMIIY